jgi:osmotically inducible protein OsmC
MKEMSHMTISKASASWEGNLKQGTGKMKPGHAPEVPFGVATRFEGAEGSNPEELVGAALAGCFSMALTASLAKAGLSPRSVRTEAQVSLDKDGSGFGISKIELSTVASVPDLEPSRFELLAQETKESCPVSKALLGTKIFLTARLE